MVSTSVAFAILYYFYVRSDLFLVFLNATWGGINTFPWSFLFFLFPMSVTVLKIIKIDFPKANWDSRKDRLVLNHRFAIFWFLLLPEKKFRKYTVIPEQTIFKVLVGRKAPLKCCCPLFCHFLTPNVHD